MGELLDATIDYLTAQKVDVNREADDAASFRVDVDPTPWTVHVWTREQNHQLLVYSVAPFVVPDERLTEMALFVARANFGLVNGNFELAVDTGELRYKTSLDTAGAALEPALLRPVFVANIATMGRYLPSAQTVIAGADAATAIAAVEGPDAVTPG
jgi:hypothetical protein